MLEPKASPNAHKMPVELIIHWENYKQSLIVAVGD